MPVGGELREARAPGSMWGPGKKAWQDPIGLPPAAWLVFKVTDVLSQHKKQRHKNAWQEMPPPRTSSVSPGSAPAKGRYVRRPHFRAQRDPQGHLYRKHLTSGGVCH